MTSVDTSANRYPIERSIMTLLSDADNVDSAERGVIDAVVRCCRRLLDTWPGLGAGTTALDVRQKPDGSLVTAADFDCERILVEVLRDAYPGSTVVTEEDDTSHGLVDSTVWLVDPLDGTTGYVAGSSDFAVLVSGWRSTEPIFSIAAFPAADIVLIARGSRILGHAGLVPARRGSLPEVHAVYRDPPGLREHLGPEVSYSMNRFESTRLMVDVARGDIDAVVVWICGHQRWDLAAPTHLIEAAGGFVSDECGDRLDLASPTMTARYVIASRDEHLHTRLIAGLNQKETK